MIRSRLFIAKSATFPLLLIIWMETYSIDFQDSSIMGNRHIYQLVQKVLGRAFPDQKPHVLKSRASPTEENENCDANGTCRIQEPHLLETSSDDGHNETKCIDYNVISVIEHEDVRSWIAA